MKMRLWLWYVPGTNEQIAEACATAQEQFDQRHVSIAEAFASTVAAGQLADTPDGSVTINTVAVAAWYAAEDAALVHLSELTGEWPAEGALIVMED